MASGRPTVSLPIDVLPLPWSQCTLKREEYVTLKSVIARSQQKSYTVLYSLRQDNNNFSKSQVRAYCHNSLFLGSIMACISQKEHFSPISLRDINYFIYSSLHVPKIKRVRFSVVKTFEDKFTIKNCLHKITGNRLKLANQKTCLLYTSDAADE